ncbi:uncharacterized protein DNG_01578 [Cephalotrichum gorgonifer]|uniref:DNA-directed RNA polymerase III subunit RPC9 n=1 Tax=Cephalotrichum gorgonifer TaxID=2041049 RepID=A0AAE8MT89_9PEZI|nr:uncharacterized protein DNG_01578 [Cephalotrichum gorgonifer]
MKILEAQNAILTNYEVYSHLTEQRERYAQNKHRGPPNLETVVREILQYFHTPPGPLSHGTITYTPECIAELIERLRPYDLTKAEVVMLFNHRPQTVATLNTIIEDLEDRVSPEDQEVLIQIIIDVLGRPPPAQEQGADDTPMENGGS